jgi:hypothetical protein
VPAPFVPVQPRLNIVIDPNTPLADLLPLAPKNVAKPANRFIDDLRKVPEVAFQDAMSSKLASDKATFEIAHQLAKMRLVNQQKTDAFMEALIKQRTDLEGMPFAMGEACRTGGARAQHLAVFSALVRSCLAEASDAQPTRHVNADKFWSLVAKETEARETDLAKTQPAQKDCDDLEAARVGVLMQVLAPETVAVRLGLVRHLSKTAQVDATKALARVVLFSAEDEVRTAALQALKLRREKDYAPTLAEGIRYPLPEVAKRAADALIRLECTDALPRLVDMLDEPDPRLPVTEETEGKKIAFVNELVRVNHHRNCMLCHAPASTDRPDPQANVVPPILTTKLTTVPKEVKSADNDGKDTITVVSELVQVQSVRFAPTLTAQVPLPNEPLPSISDGGYGRGSSPDILVRIDVTYLRQDFSMMLPVHDAAPWPDQQRFDFLVRRRVLSPEELEDWQRNTPKPVAGSTTPYQRAILHALRELTQRDTAPTSQDWRQLLNLPAKNGL